MNTVLIIGAGGREHALAWRLAQDSEVLKVIVSPGNPGMEKSNKVVTSKDTWSEICDREKINLVVIGPEKPLTEGLTEEIEKRGIPVYGPSQLAAELEGSKIYSKELMKKYGVPTADFIVANDYKDACRVLSEWKVEEEGVVIKCDGLAAGKGVVVTHDRKVAEKALHDFMVSDTCNISTDKMLFEKLLVGKEVSVFALCDGNSFKVLGMACDYKRVNDGDQGPNTGGMGCYRPHQWPSNQSKDYINREIIEKTLSGMREEGRPYKGTLFVGLMIDGEAINVVEYNVRFGDPETQTLMPLVEGSFYDTLLSCAKGDLDSLANMVTISSNSSVHVVMASEGYPSLGDVSMKLGQEINFSELESNDSQVFFAGVKNEGTRLLNSGGRVLGVTAVASDHDKARNKAYQMVEAISFDGAHWRKDIGLKKV